MKQNRIGTNSDNHITTIFVKDTNNELLAPQDDILIFNGWNQ